MPTAGWVALSPQEMRLLKLFTVSLHLRSIYEKLHVRTRSEAVPRALRDGLIH
jgi:DNA-binding CsgD family transcriptional regulator